MDLHENVRYESISAANEHISGCNPREVEEYIADMCFGLMVMADRARRPMLVYFLSLVIAEATSGSANLDTTAQ